MWVIVLVKDLAGGPVAAITLRESGIYNATRL